MVKFKDVAHLYAGCEIEYEYRFTTKDGSELRRAKVNYVGVNGVVKFLDLTAITNTGEVSSPGNFRLNINDTKPILRPLSSMTKEEDKECHNIMVSDFFNKTIGRQIVHYEAEKILYLLSKGFDLFQLIESGEATEKSTPHTPSA
jgi:hypothetical protein